MPRVRHLKCASIIPLNDRKVVSFDAIQLPIESDATSLTSQTGYRLVFDETYEEPCLSDPDDGLYHPVQALPFFQATHSTNQAFTGASTDDLTFAGGDIDRQHNFLLDSNEFFPPDTGMTIGVLNLTFAAVASPVDIEIIANFNSVVNVRTATIGDSSSSVTYKMSVPLTTVHRYYGAGTGTNYTVSITPSANVTITSASIAFVTIGNGSWVPDTNYLYT